MSVTQVEEDFDFKPQILSTSKQLKRRSWSEMSTGDQLRKDVLQEVAKQKAWQDEVQGITFKPRITKVKGVEGKLKIASEPETYLERIQVIC